MLWRLALFRRACCGARRVEGEEAGVGQEGGGTGGVLKAYEERVFK